METGYVQTYNKHGGLRLQISHCVLHSSTQGRFKESFSLSRWYELSKPDILKLTQIIHIFHKKDFPDRWLFLFNSTILGYGLWSKHAVLDEIWPANAQVTYFQKNWFLFFLSGGPIFFTLQSCSCLLLLLWAFWRIGPTKHTPNFRTKSSKNIDTKKNTLLGKT